MKGKTFKCLGTALCCMAVIVPLQGCGASSDKTEIEIVQYKPEAANYFKTVEAEFNATHTDIHLTISSPNDAMTILKTRFIREDYPDIIGIGGDINYSYFVDAEILADVSDYPGLQDINQGYLDIAEALELVQKVNKEAFKVNLDLGTMIENKESAVSICGHIAQVNHVHISEPYLATIRFGKLQNAVLEILQQEKYTRYVSIEMSNTNCLDLVKEVAKRLKMGKREHV